jgi:hypothetical protein
VPSHNVTREIGAVRRRLAYSDGGSQAWGREKGKAGAVCVPTILDVEKNRVMTTEEVRRGINMKLSVNKLKELQDIREFYPRNN